MRINQRASEHAVPMLYSLSRMRPLVLSLCLIATACASTSQKATTNKRIHLLATANDTQELEDYIKVFQNEIRNLHKADVQIIIHDLTEIQVYTVFKRVSDSVKGYRFIGVIQPNRTFQSLPEGCLIKYDKIKFHVHNTGDENDFPDDESVSTLEIVVTKRSHLVIM